MSLGALNRLNGRKGVRPREGDHDDRDVCHLPVTDLERAKAFYTAIGFTIDFTDHNSARVVVEDGHSYFMILVRDYFQSFTDRPIGDPAQSVSAATAIFLDDQEAVDAALANGIAAGGSEEHPATDYGFMYQRHLTDPDGNILEFGYMDTAAAEQGPEAASQHA